MYSTLPRSISAAKPQRMSMHFTVRVNESEFMSRFIKHVGLLSLLILMGATAMPASPRVLPGKDPGYLHALTTLRTARWFLNHQARDRKVYAGEDVAILEIDAAINEIKRASIDDGKDIYDHPIIDVNQRGSRLLRSIETLNMAHADIDQEEDNPEVRDLRHRALEHINRATRAADRAHTECAQGYGPQRCVAA
jgi:hypothetical protein